MNNIVYEKFNVPVTGIVVSCSTSHMGRGTPKYEQWGQAPKNFRLEPPQKRNIFKALAYKVHV